MFNLVMVSCFIFTLVLFLFSKKIGKAYLYFGIPTFILVFIYGYLPAINEKLGGIPMSLFFALMIGLFSIMLGTIAYFIFKNDKISVVVSILVSIVMLLIMFKKTVIISYVYVPILLVKLQQLMNSKIVLPQKTSKKKEK